jgi:hypothetical protein
LIIFATYAFMPRHLLIFRHAITLSILPLFIIDYALIGCFHYAITLITPLCRLILRHWHWLRCHIELCQRCHFHSDYYYAIIIAAAIISAPLILSPLTLRLFYFDTPFHYCGHLRHYRWFHLFQLIDYWYISRWYAAD